MPRCPHRHQTHSVNDPRGQYVRVRFNGRWYWAVKLDRAPGAIPAYCVISSEGEACNTLDAKTEQMSMLLGKAQLEKPAGMCLHYGELEVL